MLANELRFYMHVFDERIGGATHEETISVCVSLCGNMLINGCLSGTGHIYITCACIHTSIHVEMHIHEVSIIDRGTPSSATLQGTLTVRCTEGSCR